jgi:hypothetical protein
VYILRTVAWQRNDKVSVSQRCINCSELTVPLSSRQMDEVRVFTVIAVRVACEDVTVNLGSLVNTLVRAHRTPKIYRQ